MIRTEENSRPDGETDINIEAFWRTLVANTGVDHEYPTPAVYGHMIQNFSDEASSERFTNYVSPFLGAAHGTLFNWRFFVTGQGFMGLAPPGAQTGDRVCVFLGGEVPFVLRKKDDRYKFIGESYVHGIMDEEVMVQLEKGIVKLQESAM